MGKNKTALYLFLALMTTNVSFAVDNMLLPQTPVNNQKSQIRTNYFNLANIVDSFLTNSNQTQDSVIDDKNKIRKEFVSITEKFNQGNASVAYDEYSVLIDKIENDTLLLNLAKIFSEIGYFSLFDRAIDKIVYKNQFYDNINELEKAYKPKKQLNKEQEIYFAKLYSNIFFDNSASETILELLKKKHEFQKNDYAQFMLSRAYLQTKQYNHAINAINKAISLNPDNVNYQVYKIDILIASKKYNEAQKLIKKLEDNKLTFNFVEEVEIKKQDVLANTSKDDKEKKYYFANKSFTQGNFEKTKKDCQNILIFDKDNDKVISLYAKSELALGNIERANVYFVNSYKEEKNNLDTIIGLGDIRYLHGDYKNAVKMYKKAYSKDKKNYESVIKLAEAHRQYAQKQKELRKLENIIDKMPKDEYLAYYKSAISLAQKNSVLKEEYLKRALNINPMHENSLGELIELYLENKNFKTAKALIYNASFTLEKNYYYYYLCGLYNQAINKRQDAIQFYKTSLNLNPNFEIANIKLLKLIPDKNDEEI